MIDALFVFAVLCACLGAFRRSGWGIGTNWTALALLASTALTSALFWFEVQFSLWLWLAIDFAVIAVVMAGAIWRRRLPVTDILVLALFAPSWYFYVTPDPLGPDVSTLAVAAQLLLTFPARRFGQSRLVARWKANFRYRDEWTDFERRGRIGADG